MKFFTRLDSADWNWQHDEEGIPEAAFYLREYRNEIRPSLFFSLVVFACILFFLFNAHTFFDTYGLPSERPYSQYNVDNSNENTLKSSLADFYTFSDQVEGVPQLTVFLESLVGVSTSTAVTGLNSRSFELWVERNMYSFYQWKSADGFTFEELLTGNFDFEVLGYSKRGIYFLCRPFIYTYYRISTLIDFASIFNFFDGFLAIFGL